MSLNVKNCPRCGRVFARTIHDMCASCVKEIDELYELCRAYLREHKNCDLQELSEATGVSVQQLMRFLQEGRLSIVEAPNMNYPCNSCGKPIRQHNMCDDCRRKLSQSIANLQGRAQSPTTNAPYTSRGTSGFNIRKNQ